MAFMMWPSAKDCQPAGPFVVAVAGVAGSGKSTLGRALATALGAPLLDLDSLTNPLLDCLPADLFGGHWLGSPHSGAVRDGRYAALLAVTRDTVATAGRAVLVAPFTAELRGGREWDRLRAASGVAPLRMVHIDGDAELFAARRAQRREERDQHRTPPPPAPPPAVPVLAVDGGLPTEQQLRRVLAVIDSEHRPGSCRPGNEPTCGCRRPRCRDICAAARAGPPSAPDPGRRLDPLPAGGMTVEP
jgi:sugar-phosphatase